MVGVGNRREECRAGVIVTPLGSMVAVVDGAGALTRLVFSDRASTPLEPDAIGRDSDRVIRDDSAVAHVAGQLDEYFARRRSTFELDLAPEGKGFLQEAWRALRAVPYGTTVSYGELAKRLRRPTSARAIGRANAINPIAIVVPCHRVIGADGRLTGYGGGIDRKVALLELEGVLVPLARMSA